MIDMHNHSRFSPDSGEEIENIIKAAQSKGITSLGISDHLDFDFYKEGEFDYESYTEEIDVLKEKYAGEIRIFKGIEYGIVSDLERIEKYMKSREFEYKIASAHSTSGKDLYYCLGGSDDFDIFVDYTKTLYNFTSNFNDYDIIGHIDFPRRYSRLLKEMKPQEFIGLYEPTLKNLVKYGKYIEINTSGSHSYSDLDYPIDEILKLYKDVGGKYVALGSDSHRKENVGEGIQEAYKRAKKIGLDIIPRFK